MIQYFIDYTPFKVTAKYWLYFPVLYNISLLLIYFIHSSLYFLISTPILPLPPSCPSPLSSPSWEPLVLYTCESVSTNIFLKNLFTFGCFGSLLLRVAFSSCSEPGPLFLAVCRLFIAVAPLVVEHRLQARGLQ